MLYYLLDFPGVIGSYDAWTQAGLALIRQVAGRGEALRSLGAGLLQVGLLWLVVWQWFKRRGAN